MWTHCQTTDKQGEKSKQTPAHCYTTVSSVLDKHAPVITKFSRRQSIFNPWFTSTLRAFRSSVRHAENLWKRTHYALDWSSFKFLRNQYHNFIRPFKNTSTLTLSRHPLKPQTPLANHKQTLTPCYRCYFIIWTNKSNLHPYLPLLLIYLSRRQLCFLPPQTEYPAFVCFSL